MISTASVYPGVFKHCILTPTKKMLFLLSLVSLVLLLGSDSLLPPANALKRPASHAILSPLLSRGATQSSHAPLVLTDLLHSSPRQVLRTLQTFLRPSVSSRLSRTEGTSVESLKQATKKVAARGAEDETVQQREAKVGEEGEKETAELRIERALSPFFSPMVVGVFCDAHPEKDATVSELLGRPRQGRDKESSADAEETSQDAERLGREREESVVVASLEHLPASSPTVLFRLNYADTAFASGRPSRKRGEEEKGGFPREEESERDVVLAALARDRTAAEASSWARLLGRVGTMAVLPLFSEELRCDSVFAMRERRTLEDFCETTAQKEGESLCGVRDTRELYVQLPEEVSVMLKGLGRGLEERRGRREEAAGESFRLVVILMDAPDERWTPLVTRAVTRAVEEAVAVRETKEETRKRETQTEGENPHADAPSAASPLLSAVVLSLPPASRASTPASGRFLAAEKELRSLLEETRRKHEQTVRARQERLATLVEREAKRIEEEQGKAAEQVGGKNAKERAAHGEDRVSANDGERQENESRDDPRPHKRAEERTSFRDQIYDTLPDAIVKRLFPFSSAADAEREGRDAARLVLPQELQFSSLVAPEVLCWAVQQKLLTQAMPILQKWRKQVELDGKLISHFGQESSEILQTLLPLFDAATLAAVQTPARQLARRELQTLLQDELRHLYLQQLMLLERRSRTKLRASLLTALKAFPSPREAVRALWRREDEEAEEAEAARRRMRQAAEALLSDLAREAASLLPPRLSKIENASQELSFRHSPADRGAWQLPAVGNLAERAKRTICSVSQRVFSSLQERKKSLTQQLAGVPWVRARLQRSLVTLSRDSVPSQISSPSSLASAPSSSSADGESGGRDEEKDVDASNDQGGLERGDDSYEERVANEVGRRLREAASAAFEEELAQLHATLMGKLTASLRQLTEEFVASPLAEKIRIQSRLFGGVSLREVLRFSVRPSLSLTAMLRRRGEGNFQGFLAWNGGSLNMILGFANDAPVVQPDGKVAPAFRIQPKVHFDVTRASR
ncbi:hypothetical protein TGGT1_213010 [Toxoplasma gondii GT1]|uniref:Uncharacterized protein n=6 Tax=Toxoplasma gondii TaxID=5811 RepID=S7UP45_TOXGG|nr:hypothetical protein TGGT1_213010 [Toxoplasma gondii GT1]KAF4643684.1 hypothetical protein TGRH88_024390 [Toxoplasma gondii]